MAKGTGITGIGNFLRFHLYLRAFTGKGCWAPFQDKGFKKSWLIGRRLYTSNQLFRRFWRKGQKRGYRRGVTLRHII